MMTRRLLIGVGDGQQVGLAAYGGRLLVRRAVTESLREFSSRRGVGPFWF